ncbi:DUF1109 domain-containing protein [Nocardiopsis algeriensis]|uniref:DUF1109 domain-containing protein n=1 Tax=Nocardiopsis algeriensis TaxID=1478215 RepID=A0A841IQH3_9ACTN|nr:DUF1109 domain-containing protein [Nocardiopsis algeriensis]MBB6120913.1 hypothetical protein [Nocardiopsis algeriensis]
MPPGGPFGPPPRRLGLFSSPSGIRAAALNATGLGGGYFYLRRWPFFAAALTVTVGLLVTAALTGAADNLLVWVPILLAWFAAAAVHGLFAGRASDERTLAGGGQAPKGALPLLTAGGLALALVAGLTAVWQTGEWRLRVADAAHARGECGPDEAVALYGAVENGFQLSFSPSLMDRARAGAEACALLDGAQRQVAAEDYERALDTYGAYFAHTASRWEDSDGEVADIHLSYAAGLAETADAEYTGAVTPGYEEAMRRAHEIYTVIPVDYEGTAAAGKVPQALTDLYELGTDELDAEYWCDGYDQIEVFRDLDWSLAPEISERIGEERPQAALKCGWEAVDGGKFDRADTMVDVLEADYADYEAEDVEKMVVHIGAGRMEAEMDELTSWGSSEFDTESYGSSGSDDFVFEITNHTPYDMRFLYVGPDRVHGEVSVGPCDDCDVYPADSPPGIDGCFGDGEVLEVALAPGDYRIVVGYGSFDSEPMEANASLGSGGYNETCYYLTEE